MNNIDKFLMSNGQKEAGIIAAAIQKENRYHAAQSALLKCIIAREDGKGKVSPAFSDSVLEHIEEFKLAEAGVATVRADLTAILGELGEFPDIGTLADKLHRGRLAVENAEREVKIAISKASITQGEAAMESEAVIKAQIKRDQIRAEMGSTVAALADRLQKINAILEKY